MALSKEDISFIKQLITNRNKEVRHEVSDHIDNTLPPQKIAWGDLEYATQTAGVGAGTSSYVNLTGCTLELTPGTWLVWSHFESARFWNNFGAGGAAQGQYKHQICSSDETSIYANIHGNIGMLNSIDRYEVPGLAMAVITLTETTTIKLRGILYHIGGSNFSTGYRWDSAQYGAPSTLYARRIG